MSVGKSIIALGKDLGMLYGSKAVPLPLVICHLIFELGVAFILGHSGGIQIIAHIDKLHTVLGILCKDVLGVTELISALCTVKCRNI